MKFLFVLRNNELHWGSLLQEEISQNNGEVTTVTSIPEGIKLLEDGKFSADEIITGSFGEFDGAWKHIFKSANQRGMKVTLLTGIPLTLTQRKELSDQGVGLIEKDSFDLDKFSAERFPPSSGRESK